MEAQRRDDDAIDEDGAVVQGEGAQGGCVPRYPVDWGGRGEGVAPEGEGGQAREVQGSGVEVRAPAGVAVAVEDEAGEGGGGGGEPGGGQGWEEGVEAGGALAWGVWVGEVGVTRGFRWSAPGRLGLLLCRFEGPGR